MKNTFLLDWLEKHNLIVGTYNKYKDIIMRHMASPIYDLEDNQ